MGAAPYRLRSFLNRKKKSPNEDCTEFVMGRTDKVGQDHGKGNYRNRISSGTLSSLRASKRLLVATIRLLPISSPTSAVKGKGSEDPEPLTAFFYFFIHYFFIFVPFYYSRNKVVKIRGETKFSEQVGLGPSLRPVSRKSWLRPCFPPSPNPEDVAEPLPAPQRNVHIWPNQGKNNHICDPPSYILDHPVCPVHLHKLTSRVQASVVTF